MTMRPSSSAAGPTVAMALEAVNDVLTGRRRGVPHATEATSLDALRFDSLEVAELFAALEDRCGLELDPASARSLLTVGDLAQLRPFRRGSTRLL
jgi:acyl carrier protein